MATTIDELVIVLGMDTSKFTQGQKDAIEGFKRSQDTVRLLGKDVEHEGQRVGDVFQSLKREALGFLGLFLGGMGIKNFVQHVTALDAATGRAAYTLNMSARELSAWEGAGAQVGAQAGSITGAMQGLSGAMNQFMLTGQGPFLGVMSNLGLSLFDGNKKLKTAGQMFLEIAAAIEKIGESDPARAAALLAMIPGANQDSINLMVKGRKTVEELVDASRSAGGVTKESAAALAEYQKEMALLDRSASDLGRTLLTDLAPALTTIARKARSVLEAFNKAKKEMTDDEKSANKKSSIILGAAAGGAIGGGVWGGTLGSVIPFFGTAIGAGTGALIGGAVSGIGAYYALDGDDLAKINAKNRESEKARSAPVANSATSASEQEAYIREAARKRGIDPDVAVAVAKSEGLNSKNPGQQSSFRRPDGSQEQSYGPFQLYMGGGLGNKFQKETGNHPADPSTWKSQVDFALDEASKSGWGAWHGWKGLPRAGLPSPGGAASAARSQQSSNTNNTTTVSIAQLTVNTKATDAEGIANDIPGALKRANWAASSNYGLTG